jgi:2-methylisocitrate lyase-like PEP mutase family enzyme
MGFRALATTSAGYAWTTGKPDYALNRDEVLQHLRATVEAVDVPINADFESGFASTPDELAENVKLAIETGIAGLSIEDRDVEDVDKLYSKDVAVARIQAAKSAINESGENIVLVARTEILLIEPDAIKTAIDKLVAFADAGADCLYAPGARKAKDIAAIVRAVAPKPVNVLAPGPEWTVAQLADLGVRRISIGGALAAIGWRAVHEAAIAIRGGAFDHLNAGPTAHQLNKSLSLFSGN